MGRGILADEQKQRLYAEHLTKTESQVHRSAEPFAEKGDVGGGLAPDGKKRYYPPPAYNLIFCNSGQLELRIIAYYD